MRNDARSKISSVLLELPVGLVHSYHPPKVSRPDAEEWIRPPHAKTDLPNFEPHVGGTLVSVTDRSDLIPIPRGSKGQHQRDEHSDDDDANGPSRRPGQAVQEDSAQPKESAPRRIVGDNRG